MIWHVLDVRAIWVKEFAAALAEEAPTLGWCPRITGDGMFRNHEEESTLEDPHLQIRYFPLQRGFAKFPVTLIAREAERLTRRLLRRSENASLLRSPLRLRSRECFSGSQDCRAESRADADDSREPGRARPGKGPATPRDSAHRSEHRGRCQRSAIPSH